ncbi:unnamed protein product, partial [Didymodactylos carnosus]
ASLKRRSTAKRKLDYEQDNLLVLSTPIRGTNSLYSDDMLATRQSRLQQRTISSPSIKSKFRKNLYNQGVEIFQHLSQHRNEPLSQSTLRTTSIRERLSQRYGDKLHFTKLSKQDGQSSQLMEIMNRFGHSCSYKAIVRLHQEAADIVANSPSSLLPSNTQQQQQFIVKVADNFDLNKDSLHGENSIHILNQILVQTSENDELFIDVSICLNQVCDHVVNLDSRNSTTSFLIPSTKTTTSSPRKQYAPYEPFVDDSYKTILLAYGISKLACDHSSNLTTVFSSPKHLLPLLTGFCATHLQHVQRPLHTVSFCIPINADPSSIPTAELCLRTTKSSILDSNYQQEAVVVVDEKIYRNCIKAKGLNAIEFEDITIYAGDFHLMKNFQIVIWDVLTGSGIEDVLGCIYKGASLKSIWNVHHFNKSLRCCKLLYTALSILFLQSFCEALLTTATSSSLSPSIIDILQETITEIPSEYAIDDIKQKWFNRLLNSIDKLRLSALVDEWAKDNCQENVTFKFWYFILHYLLQPLITMYMSIRMSNFEGRNASLCQMAPIFFATNHRNYARLSARHLIDLRASSGYIQQRLKKSFAVNRTNRPFSFIALDQTIECSINKFGKSYGEF